MKQILAPGIAVALLAIASLTLAGQEKGAHSDAQFVEKASAGNLAEIEHGKLAESKAANAEVRDFARQMVQDHSKANAALEEIAKKKGFKMTTRMDKEHQAFQDKLQALKGNDFDHHYMMHMVESHQKGTKLYEMQANSGKDEALKAFAAKTLPTVQKHLQMAKTISEKLGKK